MKKVYLISAILALIVGISVYFFANSLQQKAQAPAALPMRSVVAAAVDIPANTQITEDMVLMQSVPAESAHAYSVSDLSQVVGMITKGELVAGEQVLSLRIVQKGQDEGSLSNRLEDGKRAVSVGVDDVSGVSGHIKKGDYVDLVVTLVDSTGKATSTALVENLLVLETGVKQSSSNTEQSGYSAVTLSATPEDAVKINYAATNGNIRLLLRPVLDNKIEKPADYPY